MNTVKVVKTMNNSNIIILEHEILSIKFSMKYVKLKTWRTVILNVFLPIPVYICDLLTTIQELDKKEYKYLYETDFIVNEYLPDIQKNLIINKELEKSNLL